MTRTIQKNIPKNLKFQKYAQGKKEKREGIHCKVL